MSVFIDDFSLITGPMTKNIIHLERQSYSLLRNIKIAILDPEMTTLCWKDHKGIFPWLLMLAVLSKK